MSRLSRKQIDPEESQINLSLRISLILESFFYAGLEGIYPILGYWNIITLLVEITGSRPGIKYIVNLLGTVGSNYSFDGCVKDLETDALKQRLVFFGSFKEIPRRFER